MRSPPLSYFLRHPLLFRVMCNILLRPNSTVSSSSRSPAASISTPASLISPVPRVSHVFLKENNHPGRRYVHQGSKWQFTRQSGYRIGLCLRSIHLEPFMGYYCVLANYTCANDLYLCYVRHSFCHAYIWEMATVYISSNCPNWLKSNLMIRRALESPCSFAC